MRFIKLFGESLSWWMRLILLFSLLLFSWLFLILVSSFLLFFFFLLSLLMLLDLFGWWIQFKTFYSFTKIETVQVIECHQMTISSKNVHEIIFYTNCLSISCTRFFTNNFSVCFIVNNFLFLLLFGWLLIT